MARDRIDGCIPSNDHDVIFSYPVVPLWRTVPTEYRMRALPAIVAKVSSNRAIYDYLAEHQESSYQQGWVFAWM